MTLQNRVSAGVPTGGEFAARARPDGLAEIGEPKYMTVVREALDEVEQKVVHAQRLIAAQAIREKLRDVYPGAGHALFTVRPDGSVVMSGVISATGNEIPPRNHLGASITPELGTIGNQAITYLGGDRAAHDSLTETHRFLMPLADDDIETRRAEFNAVAAVLPDEHLPTVAREALRMEVRAKFPKAATISVVDENDSGGAPYYVVSSILDASGEELWSFTEDEECFTDTLSTWSPLLDRDGRSDYRITIYL